mmetsp:Transcript_15918/g.51903  ORF Transcript_15918/g.51903 Transcript_15918/m.51903 type:complete len:299 (-) Transcript_15918:59-955(-)
MPPALSRVPQPPSTELPGSRARRNRHNRSRNLGKPQSQAPQHSSHQTRRPVPARRGRTGGPPSTPPCRPRPVAGRGCKTVAQSRSPDHLPDRRQTAAPPRLACRAVRTARRRHAGSGKGPSVAACPPAPASPVAACGGEQPRLPAASASRRQPRQPTGGASLRGPSCRASAPRRPRPSRRPSRWRRRTTGHKLRASRPESGQASRSPRCQGSCRVGPLPPGALPPASASRSARRAPLPRTAQERWHHTLATASGQTAYRTAPFLGHSRHPPGTERRFRRSRPTTRSMSAWAAPSAPRR